METVWSMAGIRSGSAPKMPACSVFPSRPPENGRQREGAPSRKTVFFHFIEKPGKILPCRAYIQWNATTAGGAHRILKSGGSITRRNSMKKIMTVGFIIFISLRLLPHAVRMLPAVGYGLGVIGLLGGVFLVLFAVFKPWIGIMKR
ncbi:MAG: hypothetical protein IJS14_01635 [Lentisphaeria bacterium]|nr:hypothetical protein [Lentisphaeria bacterium]